MNLPPGDVFVHRNIANVVVPSDLNCLSVLQYSVDVLKVKHVIVCGHYGCGGVRAALSDKEFGLIDQWLRHIKEVYHKHNEQLKDLDEQNKEDRLCELNVAQSVYHICQTPTVRDAWRRGQELSVHGWCYSLSDGLLKDLAVTVPDGKFVDLAADASKNKDPSSDK